MTWLSGIWVFGIEEVFPISGCWLPLLLISLWHICGSGTGASRKCRLLLLSLVLPLCHFLGSLARPGLGAFSIVSPLVFEPSLAHFY